jgi:hypothetical protein
MEYCEAMVGSIAQVAPPPPKDDSPRQDTGLTGADPARTSASVPSAPAPMKPFASAT